jgi:hypothetical protein
VTATLTLLQFAQITGAFAAELLPYGVEARVYVSCGTLFLRAVREYDDRVSHAVRSYTCAELDACLVPLDMIGAYAGRAVCRELGVMGRP